MELKRKQYPTKTTVNLVIREKTAYQISRGLCLLAIILVLVGLFSKFAVSDRLAAAFRAEAAAAEAERYLAQLQENNSGYEALRVEYARYFSSDVNEASGSADCMEVLSLVESKLMKSAGVASAVFSQNVLTVQLTGADLDQASGILADLYQSPLVSTVEIYTAATENEDPGQRSSITMTIALMPEGGGAE